MNRILIKGAYFISIIFLISCETNRSVIGIDNNNFRENWITFGGNNQHTRYVKGDSPRDFPGLKWKFKTKGYIVSGPAVYQETVFFVAMIIIYMQ